MSKCTAEKIADCAVLGKKGKVPRAFICNPATGRCVLKDGKIGKLIMKAKKSKKAKKGSKPKKTCSDDQILNPRTGRCVKKDGKIGKQLLGEKPKKKTAKKSAKKKPAKKSKKPVPSTELTYKKMIIQNNETLKSHKYGKGIFTIEVDCEDIDGCTIDIDIDDTVSVAGRNRCEMTLAKFPGTFGREAKDYKMKVSLDGNKRILNIHASGSFTCTQEQRAIGGMTDVEVDDKLDFDVKLFLTIRNYKIVKDILKEDFEI